MALRYIGSVVRPYESHGRVFLGDVPPYLALLPAGTAIHIGYSASFAKPYRLLSCQKATRGFILELAAVATPEAVLLIKNMGVFADEQLVRSLSSVEYFDDELIGCTVVDVETQQEIGVVVDIWNMPASDIWVMEYEGREIPIPAVEEYIKYVDIEAGRIGVQLIPGLLELGSDGEQNDE